MTRTYSIDLQKRVVASVERDGLSRRQGAARFGVSYSTATDWVKQYRETGSVAPARWAGIGQR
jgi:putative transposase